MDEHDTYRVLKRSRRGGDNSFLRHSPEDLLQTNMGSSAEGVAGHLAYCLQRARNHAGQAEAYMALGGAFAKTAKKYAASSRRWRRRASCFEDVLRRLKARSSES